MTRTIIIGLLVLLAGTSWLEAGEQGNLQQPVVPASKLNCHSAKCLSLSATVRLSDACWRTCGAHCAGVFAACVNDSWLNDCRGVNDRCDLSCLKTCRAHGGPLLDITD